MWRNLLLVGTSAALLAAAATGGMGLWARGKTAGAPSEAGRVSAASQRGASGAGQRAGQTARGQAQDPLPPARWPWWRDVEVQKTVGLTVEQVERLDAIVKEREAALAPFIAEWRKQLEELNRMARERKVSIDEFAVQVSRVDSLYAKLTESRTIMLYRMSRELNDAQYTKLQEVRDRRSRGGNRPSSPNR
jgi:hypothetical protein